MMMIPITTLALLSTLTVAPVAETTQPSLPSTPTIANILPTDTPAVVLVNTKGKTWANLNRFQIFKTGFTAASQFLPQTTFSFDYARDIESWLGDQVALAFMPKVGSTTATLDSSFLVVAPVKDNTRFQPFLEKLKTEPRTTVRDYKGITILEIKQPEVTPPNNTLPSSVRKLKSASQPELIKPDLMKTKRSIAIATFPGYVVIGITAQPIEQLIDASQANSTLAQNPQFHQTFQQSQSDQVLFTIYENVATVVPLINDISKDPSLSVPIFGSEKFNLEGLEEYASIDGFVSLQPQGLRLQFNAHRPVVKSKQNKDNTKKTETILDRMPGATYSVSTGRNLNFQWQQIVKGFSSEPQVKDYLQQFRNFFRSSTGLFRQRHLRLDGRRLRFFLFSHKGRII